MAESDKAVFKPSIFIKIFIGYVYFKQGIYLSLISVIVYLYPIFPDHEVLSTFSIAALPFSFKYITGRLRFMQLPSWRNSLFSATGGESSGSLLAYLPAQY
jgi:hypothetical protein